MYAFKDTYLVATFQNMILAWDTSAFFGLNAFKANLFYYMECDITVKAVNEVKKAI